ARPGNVLFLRVWFGAAVEFMKNTYGSKVAGVDMSPACLKTTQDLIADFSALSGHINGVLDGDFLKSGPYDAVFVFHVLTHSCDIHQSLSRLRGLVKSGGFVLFTHETV